MLLRKLLLYPSHSLRHLGHFIGTLRAFRSLKTISLEYSTFIKPLGTEEDNFQSATTATAGRPCIWIDMLPKSTVHVMFTAPKYIDIYEGNSDLAVAMLRDLPDSKATSYQI